MLELSAQHLLVSDSSDDVQRYRQLWQVAQAQGDRQLLHALREHVIHIGQELQQRRQTRHNRMLWLDWLGLRCSMVIPRMRF